MTIIIEIDLAVWAARHVDIPLSVSRVVAYGDRKVGCRWDR
jgi:hypothetical protein